MGPQNLFDEVLFNLHMGLENPRCQKGYSQNTTKDLQILHFYNLLTPVGENSQYWPTFELMVSHA